MGTIDSLTGNKTRMMDTAVALVLTGLFILLSVGVLALGISVYNNTTRTSSANYLHRTALSYVANQIRMADGKDGMSVRDLYGVSALALKSKIGETDFVTFLYCYDGQLREMFTEEGFEQELSSGIIIMPVEALLFEAEGESVAVTVTGADGKQERMALAPRSGLNKG